MRFHFCSNVFIFLSLFLFPELFLRTVFSSDCDVFPDLTSCVPWAVWSESCFQGTLVAEMCQTQTAFSLTGIAHPFHCVFALLGCKGDYIR